MGIDRHLADLVLEDYTTCALGDHVWRIERARVEVDDEDWGQIAIAEAQARLAASGEFAIVVLRAAIEVREPVSALGLEAAAAGQRNLSFGETYLVPARTGATPGYARYRMPDPLPAGRHAITWSYAWEPPEADGEPRVVLLPLQVVGCFAADAGRLEPLPARLDLRRNALETGPVSARRTVVVPSAAVALRLTGPGAAAAAVALDGVDLVRRAGDPGQFHLVPGSAGSPADVEFRWARGFAPLERAHWLGP
jgi:hypothetical protein